MMKKSNWLSLAALLCFLAVLLFFFDQRSQKKALGPSVATAPQPAEKAETIDSPTPAADSRLTRLPDGRSLYNPAVARSRELHQVSAERDLELVVSILGDYQFALRENPTGSENLEIMQQLLGGNAQRLVFVDPNLPALSSEGELLDQWGTPFIFHPLSSRAMEVISLGPDQTLWTEDDLTYELEDVRGELQL